MKRGSIKTIGFCLCSALVIGLGSPAYAGVQLDVEWYLPDDVVGSANPKVDGLSITLMLPNKTETKTINSYSNPSSVVFKGVQSGFGPKLFRIEWKPKSGGKNPLQVLNVWVDIPAGNWGDVQRHEIPFHVVTFQRAENKGECNIGAVSSRTVDQTLLKSIQSGWEEPTDRIGSIGNWKTEAKVAMLQGAYTLFTYKGDDWPVGYDYDYVDAPVFVGTDMEVLVDNP